MTTTLSGKLDSKFSQEKLDKFFQKILLKQIEWSCMLLPSSNNFPAVTATFCPLTVHRAHYFSPISHPAISNSVSVH